MNKPIYTSAHAFAHDRMLDPPDDVPSQEELLAPVVKEAKQEFEDEPLRCLMRQYYKILTLKGRGEYDVKFNQLIELMRYFVDFYDVARRQHVEDAAKASEHWSPYLDTDLMELAESE